MDGVDQQHNREDNRSQGHQERKEEHGHEATATAQAGTAHIHRRKVELRARYSTQRAQEAAV